MVFSFLFIGGFRESGERELSGLGSWENEFKKDRAQGTYRQNYHRILGSIEILIREQRKNYPGSWEQRGNFPREPGAGDLLLKSFLFLVIQIPISTSINNGYVFMIISGQNLYRS